mmetsp:Transcript_132780/g.230231  ORF Transcript_132780/g.230231 Transcript_132780/m.230231 type:complete len:122 (-) Transcript_132780:563-928(-)
MSRSHGPVTAEVAAGLGLNENPDLPLWLHCKVARLVHTCMHVYGSVETQAQELSTARSQEMGICFYCIAFKCRSTRSERPLPTSISCHLPQGGLRGRGVSMTNATLGVLNTYPASTLCAAF